MTLISIRENPEFMELAIKYFQKQWASEETMMVYEDCISHSITSKNPLPQWYLLLDEKEEIIGCAGLVTNDFISRGDLYPWFCALFIDENHRGNSYGKLLINKAKKDAKKGVFSHIYLCTDHIGYYEKYGFSYVGTGYHPWGESSRIYESQIMD